MKKRLKKWIVWIVIVCLVGAGGGVGYWWYTKPEKAAAAVNFTQSRVTKGTLTQSVSGSGAVEVSETETVKLAEDGTVDTVKAVKGQEVKKGDVLATFDGQDVSLNLNKSKISLQQQKLNLQQAQEKWKSLQTAGADQSDIDAAVNSIKSAQLNIEQTELEIKDYEEKAAAPDPAVAPIDGTVTEVNINAGDTVKAQMAAFTIVNYNKLDIQISADELDIANVKVGQTATISLDAFSGKTFTGKVTDIAKDGTSSNGVSTFPVTVALDNTEGVLPGMNGDVEVVIQQKQGALIIPIDAVVEMGSRYFVRVPSSGQATGAGGAAPGGAAQGNGAQGGAAQGNNAQGGAAQGNGAQGGAAQGNNAQGGAAQGNGAQGGAAQGNGAQGGAAQGNGGGFRGGQGGFTGGEGGYARGQGGGFTGGNGAARRNGGTAASAAANVNFTLKEITVGITTDSQIEVLTGLSEGDTVLIQQAAATSRTNTQMTFGAGGGFGGGGFGGGAFGGGGFGGANARGGNVRSVTTARSGAAGGR